MPMQNRSRIFQRWESEVESRTGFDHAEVQIDIAHRAEDLSRSYSIGLAWNAENG